MNRLVLWAAMFLLAIGASAQQEAAPLKLSQTTPIPQLKDGDFDHFYPDLAGNRLFATAEENSKVLVFDLKTNKLIHTFDDLKAPHSLLYKDASKKLYIVDGDLGEVRIYDGTSYKLSGSIKLKEGADASAYDSATKYYYVVNGGKDGKLPEAFISIIDTEADKVIGEIKLDSDDVEGMAMEKSGARIFVVIRGKNAVEVYDRSKRTLLATWSIASAGKKPTAIAFDEENHRLFLGSRDPAKLVVLNSDSGEIVASYPAAAMIDDLAFDGERKRIYYAGTLFLDVFQEKDPDHFDLIAHMPTSVRAKTGILIPELKKLYLAAPHHEKQSAELRVYDVLP